MPRPRFHLLDNEQFTALIPGDAPTESERKRFKSPKLNPGMPERKIWPQVGVVIQSVLKAAKCKTLSFSHVVNRNVNGGNPGSTDIFNGAGIYRDPPPSYKATEQNSEGPVKSKEGIKDPILKARSCFWLEVPVEVKSDESDPAFIFNLTKPTDVSSPCDEDIGDTGSQREEVDEGEFGEEDEDADESGDNGSDSSDGESGDGEDHSSEDDDDEGFESEDADSEVWEESEHSSSDPAIRFFKRCYPPFVNVSIDGLKALNQFVEHQLAAFKYQHRTFCYSIYICFDMARLLYFDHAGAFVTEQFSWVEPTSLLHEFVWKLAKLKKSQKREDMGHDPTAKFASLPTRRRFVREARNPALAAHIRAGFKKAAENDCPLYVLAVEDVPPSPDEWFPDEPFPEPSSSRPSPSESSESPGENSASNSNGGPTATTRRFLVGLPHASSGSLVGRCTKGYMAFDITNPKKWVPCFLKDSWRPYVPSRTRPEHLVYERLKRMNIEHQDGVATLICGGDVGGHHAQRTRVQNADMPGEKTVAPHIHYRLVTEDIGAPLSEFRNFGELSSILADALKAHHKVWEDAKVLHHDVSIGNIMIRVEGEKRTGFLIDWDLCCVESELQVGNEPVRKPDRIGTWQYRSAVSLLYPRKPYRRSDDIESFIHVFIYLVLRYHWTDALSAKDTAERFFEEMALHCGSIKVGGDTKLWMLSSNMVPFRVQGNSQLEALLDKIVARCYESYSRIDTQRMWYIYNAEEKPLPMPEPEDANKFLNERRRMRRKARENLLELGTMGEFLTDPQSLVELFEKYAMRHSGAADKALDQFLPEGHEGHYHGSAVGAKNPGNATLATKASVAPKGDTDVVPKCDMVVAGSSAPPPSLAPASLTVSAKKRAHATSASDDECADEEGAGSSSERCLKRTRVESDKGKGKDEM